MITARHIGLWLASGLMQEFTPNPNHPDYERFMNKEISRMDGKVIYCVHGTADFKNGLYLLKNRLLEKTLPPDIAGIRLVSFEKRFRGTDIVDFSNQLMNQIKHNGDTDVYLVGHSRGGDLVAYIKEYLALMNDVNILHAWLVAGVPGGSIVADIFSSIFGISESIKQMRTDAPFSKELRERMMTHPGEYTFFVGDVDFLASMQNSYVPELRSGFVLLEGHDHISITSSHRLVDIIHQRVMGMQIPLSLDTVCNDITAYLSRLRQKYHFFSSAEKIAVLEKLLDCLYNLKINGRGDLYPRANTIGEFIDCFLHDASICNGIKPIDKLKESLTFPSLFFNPTSSNVVDGWQIRYMDTPIIEVEKREELEINRKQSL